ncbi:MAG TPA: hypothetical protein VLH35_08055 [Candidatus Acidoferrales bacterium]|nr:hypothetical protein [Candidatus Acidoferrales bacterium]
MDGNVLCMLDDLEAPAKEFCNRGVKLSSITAKLKDSIDVTPFLGRFQQLGFIKIVYNPSVDDEPLVQITDKGKLQIIELLLPLQPTGK